MMSKKRLLHVALAIAVLASCLPSCKKGKTYRDYFDKSQLECIAKLGKRPQLEDKHLDSDTAWLDDDGFHRLAVEPLPGSYKELFQDYNNVQIPHATRNGIEPIKNFHDAYRLRQPIVKIATCEAYYLDSLTHSMPYLVPKAALLLEEIGCAFSDSVKAHGGSAYRIVVTSCTRSDFTVQKLLKVNRNASARSCHMFGTTFDLNLWGTDIGSQRGVYGFSHKRSLLLQTEMLKQHSSRENLCQRIGKILSCSLRP